jgi:aspartate/methionine/tyrosine aminotransferase
MRIDESWEKLYFPDFSPYESLDPSRAIDLVSADPFAPQNCIPKFVTDAIKKAIDDGEVHYATGNGHPLLKKTLQKKIKQFNRLDINPETDLLLTPGSAFGLYLSIRICVRPNMGDDVINFDPSFAENFNDVYMMGARSVICPLYKEDGFQIRLEELDRAITPRTRCLVLTNPNNPTGTVHKKENLEGVARLVTKHDLIAVVDQSFERNIYDGHEYTTFATLPGMRERTITVFGTSKDLGLTGFRLGYVVAPPQLIRIMKIATSNMVGCVPTAAQFGVIAAYEDPSYVDEWNKVFDRRRRLGCKVFNSIPNVSCLLPEGGYFLWPDVTRLGTSTEIVTHLVKDAQVAVGSGHWFGKRGDGFLRIMYGRLKDDSVYEEALERIKQSLSKLSR